MAKSKKKNNTEGKKIEESKEEVKQETQKQNNKKATNKKAKTTKKEVENKIAEEEVKQEIKEELNNKKDATEEEFAKILDEEEHHFFDDTFVKNVLWVTLFLFLIELIFKALNDFSIFDYSTLRILISCFMLSFIVTFIGSLTKRRWLRNTIVLLFIFVYAFYTWLQLGFINYLGVYMSFHTSSQFGAVKDYIGDYLNSFKLVYYVIFTPFILAIVYYVLRRKKEYQKIKINKKYLLTIPTLIISGILYYLTLTLPFMQNELQIKSNMSLFVNPDVPTVAVNQFGTTVFGLVDLKSFLLPTEVAAEEFKANAEENNEPVSRQVSEALKTIAESETNSKYKSLNNYFVSQKVTDYNEYTGMFEGKNVVVILMESVNEAIIDEKNFPNFYKMYNEGWHWENNYSPRNSCATGNNEFSAMTGLYSIYNTCTTNVYRNNKYFEAIFNLFNNKGYNTTSMHDFVQWYYKRKTYQPNMGSQKYYGADDLDIKTAGYYGEWPSDEEFFEKAMDIVLNDDSNKPWMTWLTTVTSHQPYTNNSTYGNLYKDDFKAQGYSTSVSRYLSKLKVLDNALGIMLDKLEKAGELDNTVIVMTGDHYPYGLSKSSVAEMIDHDLSEYEIEKTPFVIYNSTMTPKTFKEYNSYINLVPTVANLLGLEYDPRLYAGSDVLSDDYESRVVFADGSWKNEIAYYNASTSKIKYYGDKTYTPEEIQAINTEVGLKIDMSSKAIKSNYFNYLEKEIAKYNEEHKMVSTPEGNITPSTSENTDLTAEETNQNNNDDVEE